eukprot:gnl/TRDRNA2_/TRDRNA2_154119_c0_seq2.p1 gnl/TRDRNA2_/TRDRNA2_154119_c0~~gnl/TRDRNA2_/TRDRNA2_154119_c0_seq2.p1  ORF type:complete len:281 (+),score=34.99 gnl/TRDRNA2_/TRDRNA2_154119_c0_seq2:115-957(+)
MPDPILALSESLLQKAVRRHVRILKLMCLLVGFSFGVLLISLPCSRGDERKNAEPITALTWRYMQPAQAVRSPQPSRVWKAAQPIAVRQPPQPARFWQIPMPLRADHINTVSVDAERAEGGEVLDQQDVDEGSAVKESGEVQGEVPDQQDADEGLAIKESGVVQNYLYMKGYGFLESNRGDLLFVHRSKFSEDVFSLRPGDQVTFVRQKISRSNSSQTDEATDIRLVARGPVEEELPHDREGVQQGRVVHWNYVKKFGFIRPKDGNENGSDDIFFSQSKS